MPSTKEIRRRIKSTKSTRQITHAMELVAAAKMRRAQLSALASRIYAALAHELLKNLSGQADPRLHKLLTRPAPTGQAAVVLMSSNRGLIGAFNQNLVLAAVNYAKQLERVEFLTLGKRGRDQIKKLGYTIAADFEKKDSRISVLDIVSLAQLLINDFTAGKYDKAALVYMEFVSTLVQRPRILELLPLTPTSSPPVRLRRIGGEREGVDYLFEPTIEQVLETLLPRLVTMQVYQALLETNAAEHSARMVAMKNATEAAGDLIDELTLEFNQLRQAAITKEISEIVAGRLALEAR